MHRLFMGSSRNFCDEKSVRRALHDLPSFLSQFRLALRNKETVGLPSASADATSQLMQLCKAEPLRIFDDDHRSIRHVDPDFDHDRRYQHIDFSPVKLLHHLIFFHLFHAPVDQCHFVLCKAFCQLFIHRLRRFQIQRVGIFDERSHNVSLSSLLQLFFYEVVTCFPLFAGHISRLDHLSARRHLIQY